MGTGRIIVTLDIGYLSTQNTCQKSRLVKIGQNILETEVRLTCIFLGRWIVLGGEEFSEIREKHRNTCFMSNTYFPRNHTACAI